MAGEGPECSENQYVRKGFICLDLIDLKFFLTDSYLSRCKLKAKVDILAAGTSGLKLGASQILPGHE